MFKDRNKLFLIQKINEIENCRVYNELEVTPIQAFYSELEVYFNQYIEKDYNIYILNNKPIHKIKFNSEEINYISMEPYTHWEEPFNYYFSENMEYIKEHQSEDFKWLLLPENEIDFLIIIPNLDIDNKYYYNFVVGLKNSNKINNFIKHKFNLIKIDNIQYLNQIMFDIKFLEKLFKIKNIENESDASTIFRDIGYTKYENEWLNNYKGQYFPVEKYIKSRLKKISFHFYYNEDLKNLSAYTNFWELVNGVTIQNIEKSFNIYNTPYPISFIDIISNNEFLFFVCLEIKKFHWTKIDWERNYLSFLVEQIKNFNWNDTNMKSLNWKKNELKKCKKRLREYRKLLKDCNKNKIK